MRIAMGMLCFNRPIHTALTIAFALHNKSVHTDFYAFYGIHKDQAPPSRGLDNLLKDLYSTCGLKYIYMDDSQPNNVQGNVDTLMSTLTNMPDCHCFCKIDDDVLIGRGSDVTMANILTAMESENVKMLMGQAVPEHMRRANPFCWEARVNNTRVVQRAQKACPMETYTFVSMDCLKFLKGRGMGTSCENARGTFGPFTRKVVNAGGKACLVLTPAILMQHIGLTTTIEASAPTRSWAPARSWDPMDQVIQLPGFDFTKWEASHRDNTQKAFAIDTITALSATMPEEHQPATAVLLKHMAMYKPEAIKALGQDQIERGNPKPVKAPPRPPVEFQPRNPPGTVLRRLSDGRIVRSPGPVNRVVIRQTA